jgi:hypothetical protein
MCPANDHDLTREILRHMIVNPEEGDTLYSIARPWVLKQQKLQIEVHVDDVKKGIAKLVDQGLLQEYNTDNTPGEVVKRQYKLNPLRLGEIRALLNKGDS